MGFFSWVADKAEAAGGAVSSAAGAVKDGTVAAARGVKNAAVATGSAVKNAAVATGGAVKDAAVWTGDRVSAAAKHTAKAGVAVYNGAAYVAKNPLDAATAAKDSVVGGAVAVKDGAVSAGKWVGDKAVTAGKAVGNGVSYVYHNPGEALGKAKDGIVTAAVETKNFTVYAAKNPGRAAQMTGQGLLNAVVATGGSIADLGVMAHNHSTRHLANGALSFVGLEDQHLDKVTYNCTDQWIAGSTFVKPENNYERVMAYGTQALGEVASFVGLTIVTSGGYAAVRGTAAGARGATLAGRVAQTAGRTARIVSPLASKFAAATELAAAGTVFGTGMTISLKEEDIDKLLTEETGLTEKQLMKMTLDEKVEKVEEYANEKLDTALIEGGYTAEHLEGKSLDEKATMIDEMVGTSEQGSEEQTEEPAKQVDEPVVDAAMQEEINNYLIEDMGLSEEDIADLSLEEKAERIEVHADKKVTGALRQLGISDDELENMSFEQKNERINMIVEEMEAANPDPVSEQKPALENPDLSAQMTSGGIKTDVSVGSSFSSAAKVDEPEKKPEKKGSEPQKVKAPSAPVAEM